MQLFLLYFAASSGTSLFNLIKNKTKVQFLKRSKVGSNFASEIVQVKISRRASTPWPHMDPQGLAQEIRTVFRLV